MASLPDDPTRDLVARFVYKPDSADRWTLLDAAEGPLIGDCEDFALTALWLLCGRSWWVLWWRVITMSAVLWNVQTRSGVSHACLWVRGRGWICNIYPNWSRVSRHRRRLPYIAPLLLLTLILK